MTSDVDSNQATEARRGRARGWPFAPPLLALVAVGAVAGRVIGEFAGYRVGQDVHGPSDS